MSFETSDFATQFYQAYHLQLLQEVFAVMTGNDLPSCPACCACYQGTGSAAVFACLLQCKHRAHSGQTAQQAAVMCECVCLHTSESAVEH